MQTKHILGIGSIFIASLMTVMSPSFADYPAIPGLPLVAGSFDTPISIDPTPKTIPANSRETTLSTSQKSLMATPGEPTVCKFTNLPKSTYVEATIKSANGKSSAFLGAVTTDKNGKLQLPAFGLSKPGTYTLTMKVGKVTRIIKVIVK